MSLSITENYGRPPENIYTSNEKEADFNKKTFECNLCQKHFRRKASFTVHLNSHSVFGDLQHNNHKGAENVCSVCYKKFTAKKNLLKHLRDVHKNFKEAARMVVKKIKCPETNCDFKCRMMKELRDHIEVHHHIKILKDVLEFPDESVFQKWKKEEESNTVSWFVTGRKKTTLISGTKRQIFYCHRTGHYSPKGLGKYRMRSVGSCKIGVTCPAAMEVTEHSNGQVTVIYYKTHLGHSQDVVYLKLSREEKANLAEKIEKGFTFESILEDVREGIDVKDSKKKRLHLLSKKDLYSIMRSSNESQGKKIKEKFDGGGVKIKSGFQVEEIEKSGQDNLVVKNLEMSKFDGNVEQNFTLYPGQSVILPQEYSEIDSAATFSKNPNPPQNLGDEISSQILILSRNVDCTSVAEIILLSAGETVVQSRILPTENIKIVDAENSPNEKGEENSMGEPSLREKNKLNKTNLRLELKEKLDRMAQFLPRSEFLTPKQFSFVERKMEAILNVFREADAKAERKTNGKRKSAKKATIEKTGENN